MGYIDAWLARHQGFDLGPRELLLARLSLRQRVRRLQLKITLPATIILAALYVVFLCMPPASSETNLPALGVYFALAMVLTIATWFTAHCHRTGERHIARDLTARIARSEAVRLRTMLGPWTSTAVAVSYGGGLVVGGVAAVMASSQPDRITAVVFLIGLVVLGGMTALALKHVLHRPALAVDPGSLLADDLLRTEDARGLAAPLLPMLLAGSVMLAGQHRSGTSTLLDGFVIVCSIFVAVAALKEPNQPRVVVPR
ncbi:MAG: hypothetical protein JOZ47_22860 [Kutzneria sp.]|nr:hypothetical protein [Kutzneria sp.]